MISYIREFLIRKKYAKDQEDYPDFQGKITKFDKKIVRPFLDDLKSLFEKHGIMIEPENVIIIDYDDKMFYKFSGAEVDLENFSYEKKEYVEKV